MAQENKPGGCAAQVPGAGGPSRTTGHAAGNHATAAAATRQSVPTRAATAPEPHETGRRTTVKMH